MKIALFCKRDDLPDEVKNDVYDNDCDLEVEPGLDRDIVPYFELVAKF
jgi:hypothetical protein